MSTSTPYTPWPMIPQSSPMRATIMATSPLGAMPKPTISASFMHRPPSRVGTPHPMILVAMATAVIMRLTAVREEPPIPVFRADHPFLFLIQDTDTGKILFLGRVMDPVG